MEFTFHVAIRIADFSLLVLAFAAAMRPDTAPSDPFRVATLACAARIPRHSFRI
jgi:hypothetical protein